MRSPAERTVPTESQVFIHALKRALWCFPQINHHCELIKWEDSLLSTAQNVKSIFQTVKVSERMLPPLK